MFLVKFADIGEGIHEGVLLKYFVEEGQTVEEGDDLFTLETDKVNAEIPSPASGKVVKRNYKVGANVNVGDVIVEIDDGQSAIRSNMGDHEEGPAAVPAPAQNPETPVDTKKHTESVEEQGSTSVVGQIEVSSEVIPSSAEAHAATPKAEPGKRKALATPVARKMAKDLGVDINTVEGTGPHGRVMKADIQKAADAGAKPAPQTGGSKVKAPALAKPSDQTEVVPMTMLRRTIAENMTLSKQTIPHTLVMDEGNVEALVDYRQRVKALAHDKGVKLTYLAFFVKATVIALKKYPYMNASIDMEKSEIHLKHYYNIGIAVDTPEGLMVPVIKNADKLSLFEIADKIETLTNGARERTIGLEDLKDGTFTITNYGAVGASFGAPVIKYPEAGILGVGSILKKPVVEDDEIVIRSMLPLSLSFDHRIIDGADAGRFLATVKELLSQPDLLLLM